MKLEPGCTIENEVRLAVYRHLVSAGRAPTIAEAADALALDHKAACEAFEALERGHVLVLEPDTREVWMAMPLCGAWKAGGWGVVAGDGLSAGARVVLRSA